MGENQSLSEKEREATKEEMASKQTDLDKKIEVMNVQISDLGKKM